MYFEADFFLPDHGVPIPLGGGGPYPNPTIPPARGLPPDTGDDPSVKLSDLRNAIQLATDLRLCTFFDPEVPKREAGGGGVDGKVGKPIPAPSPCRWPPPSRCPPQPLPTRLFV